MTVSLSNRPTQGGPGNLVSWTHITVAAMCPLTLPMTSHPWYHHHHPHHPSPITHYPSPITHHPLPITNHPSHITHYPLPITHMTSHQPPWLSTHQPPRYSVFFSPYMYSCVLQHIANLCGHLVYHNTLQPCRFYSQNTKHKTLLG